MQESCETEIIDDICQRNLLYELCEQYIDFCLFPPSQSSSEKNLHVRLPNICGFFRWLKLSASSLDYLKSFYSNEYRTLLMIFEDEALNSPLPPSIISTYMKQSLTKNDEENKTSLTYDEGGGCPINLIFDHDISSDGL